MKRIAILAIALLSSICISCKQDLTVSSPDGRIKFGLGIEGGRLSYNVRVDTACFVLPSALGLQSKRVVMDKDFKLMGVKHSSVSEAWTSQWGENKEHQDVHNELEATFKNPDGVVLTIRARAFDDGVGFRYEYKVPGDSVKVTDELTEFRLASGGTSWSIPANFNTYELEYRTLPLADVADANTPFTFKTDEGLYGSIHEAALYDYPEMTLRRFLHSGRNDKDVSDSPRLSEDTLSFRPSEDSLSFRPSEASGEISFRADLAPWPDGIKARVPSEFHTPWRVILITKDAAGLVNSDLILNLNEPCAIEDVSWIKPQRYVGVWWGMHLGIEAWYDDGPGRHGATTANAIKYIDFAAKNGIEGVLFEGWNDGWASWGSREDFDFTKPAPDFDFEKVIDYAASKGINYILHHETGGNIVSYEAQLDKALDWAAAHGIHSLKTGYAGGISNGHSHHGQYMVRHYQKVVEEAAKRQIMVDAHEPIKATGIRRTWPNFMCREGARGMEWNAWSEGNKPEHQTILSYTRLLGGPMDYTPGVFDIQYRNIIGNKNLRMWNNNRLATECRCNTTLAKQIADWVVLYSPMQMACDLVENYEGHPAFQFFRDYNADCDWSRALAGEVGDYIVVARRAGEVYFLGAVTDENARTLEQPLDFLPAGKTYAATIYADGADASWEANPYSYQITSREVTSADTLTLNLATSGGCAIVFKPVK